MSKPYCGVFVSVLLAIFCVASTAFGGNWSTSGYVVSEWECPVGRIIPNSSSLANISDGDVTSFSESVQGKSYTCTWESPVDIESIHFFTMDNGGGNGAWSWAYEITSLAVMCEGESDYTVLDNSYVFHDGSVPGGQAYMGKEFTFASSGKFVLKNVIGIRITNGNNIGCGHAHGCGEIVFIGESSVGESLAAEYLAAAGQYSAKASAVAADYPVDVYFCSGATDGGTTVAGWDKVVKAGTLTSSNDVCEVSGSTDFAHCRFYFPSPRYGENVWSAGLAVNDNPAFQASVGERRTDSVAMIATIQSPGASSASCDVYFAYALQGETLPTVELVKSGVAVGEAVTNVVTGLSPALNYDYKFVVRNAQSGEREVLGSFSSLPAGVWNLTPFESKEDYVLPEDWLPGGQAGQTASQGYISSGSADWYSGEDHARIIEFKNSYDIKRIDLYTFDHGRKNVALTNVWVKYSGADNYVEMPGTSLALREDVGYFGIKYSLEASDAFLATNVVGVKIVATYVQSGYVSLVGQDVIGVPHDCAGNEYKWDFNYVDGKNFTRPANLITNFTCSGISDNENDGDISTVTGRSSEYSGYTWTFSKPYDLTSIGLHSNGGAFAVASVSVMYKGDSEYTQLPGSYFDYFDRGSNIVSSVLRPTGKYIARNVRAVHVSLGYRYPFWTDANMAEVYVSGRESPKGLVFLVR